MSKKHQRSKAFSPYSPINFYMYNYSHILGRLGELATIARPAQIAIWVISISLSQDLVLS